MKTAKKLCQTMLSFILICSMFFGTGITSVIAEGIDATAVANNITEVKTLVDDFKALDGYEQNTGVKDVINSIEDQLTIIQSMIDSGDLSLIEEKNNYLESIKTILYNILDYDARFEALISNIFYNMETYDIALNDLESAEELSNDNGAIHDYIQYRITEAETAGNTDLATALNELNSLIGFAENVVKPGYETMTTADYGEYANVYETLYSQYILMSLSVPEDLELTNDQILLVYTLLSDTFVDYSTIFPDVGFGEYVSNIENIVSNNNLKNLVVNGLELDVKELSHTVYVGYELTNLEVIATAEDSKATVSITKPDVLVVGDNAVTVKVVALNGEVKEYKVNVVKLAQNADQGDAQDETTPVETTENVETEVTPTYTSNDTTDEVEEKTETTTEKDDKEYDEEIEEEGLNGFTILLIVGGIALIGFGIYMLFGDKDDEQPKVKETKKVEPVKPTENKKQNKTNNNKNSNKSKKKNKK